MKTIIRESRGGRSTLRKIEAALRKGWQPGRVVAPGVNPRRFLFSTIAPSIKGIPALPPAFGASPRQFRALRCMKTHLASPEAHTGGLKLGAKRDVAAFLGVCPRTVDNLLRRGLPHLKLSQRIVRFDLEECARWTRENYGTRRMGPAGEARV